MRDFQGHANGLSCSEAEDRLQQLRGELANALAALEDARLRLDRIGMVAKRTRAVMDACEAIPDITLSPWACNPGGHWEPVRESLRAPRKARGFDVTHAQPEDFDIDGWLHSRQRNTRKDDPQP